MKKKRNIPLIIIGASIPFMWALVYYLSGRGFFEWLEYTGCPDGLITVIVVLIANIPVLIFIGYGIYNAVTTKPTIPKVKEYMPWDKGSPLDVDSEWKAEIKEVKEHQEDR